MKLTKKILSLVLAVALVLGSIAVAANAADYDGLAYEGSKLTYKVTADKTEVKPGETVTFSVYMTTNYYTGSAGGELFLWDAGVFSALGSNYKALNFRTEFTPGFRNPAAPNSYTSPYLENKDAYVGFQATYYYDAIKTQARILNNELVYEFTFTVLETATPGTKATFFVPAEAVRNPNFTGMKAMIYQGIGTSATDPTSTVGYSSAVDLSEASVTITVASAKEYCDYTDLTTAVAKAPEKAAEYYDTAAYDAWVAAKAAGQALLDAEALEKSDENQKAIDDAAQLIEDKLAALVPSYLSLDKLNAAVDACDEIDPADKAYYDADDYDAWEAALAAAKDAQGKYTTADPATKQAEVDAIADTLTEAYGKLKPAYVSLDKLNTAVDSYDELDPADKDYYDADDYAAWEAALADAKAAQTTYANAPATKQAEVDKFADDLQTAFEALVPATVNLDALNSAIADCTTPAKGEEFYGATEYAAWEKALADAQNGVTTYTGAADTAANQQAVAALANDLRDAFAALVPAYVNLDALNSAIADCTTPAKGEEFYGATEYAAWEKALADAQNGVTTYTDAADTAANQQAVAALAKDLRDAFAALVPQYVNADAIAEAIAAATPEYSAEYYDTAAYEAFEKALAAAKVADFTGKADTEANRAEVAQIAGDLANAFAKLVPAFVSYEKLEKAIADYSTTENPDFYYTPDSWNAYADALAEAKDANDNRPDPLPAASDAEAQAAIDAYATDLEDAYNKLAPAGDCTILSVTPLQEVYDVRDVVNFEVVLENTGYSKIQFIRSTGDTLTYKKDHESVKSITVNEDGNEVWVIARRIYEEECTEYARAKVGNVWETGLFAYDLKCNGEDYAVKSVDITVDGEAVTSATKKDVVTITIVTGPAARRVRLVNSATGGTMTYNTPSEVRNDGTKVWVINKTFSSVKTYDFDVHSAGSANVLEDSGIDFSIQITKAPVSQVPSTGDVADAVNEELTGVSSKRMVKGSTQTFTIVTDKDAKAVRITSNAGVTTTIKTAASTEGDEKTWICEKVINNPGEYSYTVEALYGSTWHAAEGTLDFKVIY